MRILKKDCYFLRRVFSTFTPATLNNPNLLRAGIVIGELSHMASFELKSGPHGKSMFASELIRAGVELMRFSGKPLDFEESIDLKGINESFALQISMNFYLMLDEPARYFNHSCEPNCGLRDLQLITLREVAKGEELTYDYSTTMLERHWNMKCNCGKKHCRKVVSDFDQLPAATKAYYLSNNVVQPFIVEALRKRKIS